MSGGPFGPELLRDRDALQSADRAFLVPAAGSAGAQVRSVADQLAGRSGIDRPRALVVVGATAEVDAAALAALAGPRTVAPIVAVPELPAWVGPLDVVVVLASGRDDEPAARAAAEAQYRGATTVVRAAATGPVAEIAGAALLPAEVAVPEALATPARWSLLAGVAALAGLLPAPDLPAVADLLDAVTLALTPGAESFANPALNIAEFLADGTPLLIGIDPVSDAVAAHGARVLADIAGSAAATLPSALAGLSPALLARTGGERDIFADPGDAPPAAVRPVLVAAVMERPAPARALLSGLRRALPRAVLLESPEAAAPDGGPAAGGGPAGPAGSGLFGEALVAVLQIDFTAVYLGLVAGQLMPADYPDGLGRVGGTRWAVRPAAVADTWDERDD